MNGRRQAIRPPKEFRVASAEFFLKKTSGGFTVIERDPWEVFEAGGRALSDDFMSKRVPPPLEKSQRMVGAGSCSAMDNKGERFVAVLEIPPVDSPLTAVKVSIVSDIKSGKLKAS